LRRTFRKATNALVGECSYPLKRSFTRRVRLGNGVTQETEMQAVYTVLHYTPQPFYISRELHEHFLRDITENMGGVILNK